GAGDLVVLGLLEDLRQFSGESALRLTVALPAAATIIGSVALFRPCTLSTWRRGRSGPDRHRSALGRLRRVGPKNFILEGCAVEAANNRLHLVRCGDFHE